MDVPLKKIDKIINNLKSKPGHETLRCNIYSILTDCLKADVSDIKNEKCIITGRIDTLWQKTIFEFKSNLKTEKKDAEIQLKKYISELEKNTEKKFIGISTDGLKFIVYSFKQ